MPQPRIDYYDFGHIVVGGRDFVHDVVITPERVVPDWWRLEGHRLQLPDVRDYLLEEVDAVVIGTGYSGLMRVDGDVVEAFARRGRRVYVERTRRAVELYNRLVGEGKKVLAFLHITC